MLCVLFSHLYTMYSIEFAKSSKQNMPFSFAIPVLISDTKLCEMCEMCEPAYKRQTVTSVKISEMCSLLLINIPYITILTPWPGVQQPAGGVHG